MDHLDLEEKERVQRRVSELAKQLVSEEGDFLANVRELSSLSRKFEKESADPDFIPFIALDSDTDHMPDDSRRHLCASQWLEKCDSELAAVKARWKHQILECCRRLVERFGGDH